MLAAAAFALFLQAGAVLDGEDLRRLIEAHRKTPEAPQTARFALELPLVSDNRTDLGSLQNPVGWTYDKARRLLLVSVDFGAVTPENYKAFDSQHLEKAPPLRTIFFESRIARDAILGRSIGVSYGLAVPTSTEARGVQGGDLPDGFTLPFVVQIRRSPLQVDEAVRLLRLRVEGELRTIGGKSVLCSDNVYDGYAVNHVGVGGVLLARDSVMVMDNMCLVPAIVTRVALVSTQARGAMHEWRRASTTPTPETPETAVTIVTDHRAPRTVLGDPTTTVLSPIGANAPGGIHGVTH